MGTTRGEVVFRNIFSCMTERREEIDGWFLFVAPTHDRWISFMKPWSLQEPSPASTSYDENLNFPKNFLPFRNKMHFSNESLRQLKGLVVKLSELTLECIRALWLLHFFLRLCGLQFNQFSIKYHIVFKNHINWYPGAIHHFPLDPIYFSC